MMFRRGLLIISVAGLLAVGCYRPQGPLMNYTGAARTFYSSEHSPKNVTIMDTRSGEEIFNIEIPVGKQFVMDFVPDAGNDPVLSPDAMRWALMDLGNMTGRLRNQISVPGSSSRRIDVNIRSGPEYVEAPPQRELRMDLAADHPAWWTPEGGPLPTEKVSTMYDD